MVKRYEKPRSGVEDLAVGQSIYQEAKKLVESMPPREDIEAVEEYIKDKINAVKVGALDFDVFRTFIKLTKINLRIVME